MDIKEKQIQKGKEVLLKYLLPDALKPEYDGLTAYELAKIILREAERVEYDEMAKDEMAKNDTLEEVADKEAVKKEEVLCEKCGEPTTPKLIGDDWYDTCVDCRWVTNN